MKRADLIDLFGVNPAQAASDFGAYMQIAPGNMDYNKSRKRYLPLPSFTPKFIHPATLDEFVDLTSPVIEVEKWPLPQRVATSETLQSVVRAIRSKLALEIRYQSMTDPKPSWRWISPHAFASDGDRWHVRAFCHKRNEFRDFVLGRIILTRNSRATDATPDEDVDWRTFVTAVLAPNQQLSEDQRAAIAAEHGMPRNHELRIRLRKSMLFYLNARFSPQPDTVAAAHQLIIVREETD